MEKQSKKVLLTGALLLSAFGVFAQGNGSAGINEATQMVTSYFDPATQLIYAIGAVVGLIGGVKVITNSVPATLIRARLRHRGLVRVSS